MHLRALPFSGRTDTGYHSFQLAADVMPDIVLLNEMLNTGDWKANIRYDARELASGPQLWADFARASPIKRRPAKTRSFLLKLFAVLLLLYFFLELVLFLRSSNYSTVLRFLQ